MTDPLAPLRGGKVAILGTAVDTIDQAPWKDESWELWMIGAGMMERANAHRWDRWFEIHGFGDGKFIGNGSKPGYFNWLDARQEKGIIYVRSDSDLEYLPNAAVYPKDRIVERYGRYLASTMSWMLALAIDLGAKEIGVWGCNMAAQTEYGGQRSSAEYFLGLARGAGIKTYVPEGSDLLKCHGLYGFDMDNKFAAKLTERKKEFRKRLAQEEATIAKSTEQRDALKGAIDDLNYWEQNWL